MKWAFMFALILWFPHPVWAGSKAKEVAEFVLSKFGKEAVKEGVDRLKKVKVSRYTKPIRRR